MSLAAYLTGVKITDGGATEERRAYLNLQNSRVTDATSVVKSLATVYNTNVLTKTFNVNPHISCVPIAKFLHRAQSIADPSLIRLLQKNAHHEWKKCHFMTGRGVQEGSLLYLKETMEKILAKNGPSDESLIKEYGMYITHKDFMKAYLLFTLIPKGFKDTDEYKFNIAVSSFGFSDIVHGKKQKPKGGVNAGTAPGMITTADVDAMDVVRQKVPANANVAPQIVQ
jgi:hypothetical protein